MNNYYVLSVRKMLIHFFLGIRIRINYFFFFLINKKIKLKISTAKTQKKLYEKLVLVKIDKLFYLLLLFSLSYKFLIEFKVIE